MSFTTIISPEDLAAQLEQAGWRVVDCRFDLMDPAAGRQAWQAQHIPGAVFADLETDLSSPVQADGQGGRHPLPTADHLMSRLGGWGISPQTQVVAYDHAAGMMAGRLWWLLRWLGHESVAVLDGGLTAWEARGLPLTAEPPVIEPVAYRGQPGSAPVITAAQIELGLQSKRLALIDARATERFAGLTEPLDKVAGHIPGAVNLPLTENLDSEQRFLPAAELRQLYAPAIGSAEDVELAVMCGSGVSACHSVLAMTIAGLPMPALYTGSWSDWISNPARPVATA